MLRPVPRLTQQLPTTRYVPPETIEELTAHRTVLQQGEKAPKHGPPGIGMDSTSRRRDSPMPGSTPLYHSTEDGIRGLAPHCGRVAFRLARQTFFKCRHYLLSMTPVQSCSRFQFLVWHFLDLCTWAACSPGRLVFGFAPVPDMRVAAHEPQKGRGPSLPHASAVSDAPPCPHPRRSGHGQSDFTLFVFCVSLQQRFHNVVRAR